MSLAARVLNPRPVVTATLDALRDRITRVWRCRETDPDAWAALQSHPQLWNDKGVVLDLAYEEYFLRENAGQALDSEVFCERFAPYRSSLRKLIHAHQWLTPHLDKLEEPPPPAEAIRWPETGETIGDFTLLRELGRGSFARVFLAVEARAGNRKVVIKLTAHSGDEAHTLGQLDHPNIVPLLSAPWIAETKLTAVCMPYMGAATLHDLIDRAFPLRDSPPPRFAEVIVEAARSTAHPGDPQPRSAEADPHLRHDTYVDGVLLLGAQLAEALAYVHERGVLHSDLKPSNVLLSPDGRPLLIDFNLSTEPRTLEARQGGTLPYMAPEQLHAFITETPVNLDAQSDLFSLGVLLYELLTGKLPYGPLPASCNSYDLAALLLKRQKTGFVPICHHNPDVSHFGARMVEQCLAFDAANRPSSAAALAEELRRYFKPAAKRYRWVVRNVVALICAVCVLLISMGTAAVGLAVRDSAAVREARQAKAAMENGEFARAVEHFSGAIAANPEQSSAWFDRGQARLHWSELLSGKEAAATIEEALADFKRSKKLQPDTGDLA